MSNIPEAHTHSSSSLKDDRLEFVEHSECLIGHDTSQSRAYGREGRV